MGAKRVFISYRRKDSDADAGRLFEVFSARFGRERTFMDVDNVPLGANVRTHITEAIAQSAVMVVVIGPVWEAQLLERTNDWIRVEIEPLFDFAANRSGT